MLVLLEQSQDISLPSLVPGPVPAIGSTVGRYVLLSHLGSGGMGTVYSARDQDLDRTVALKFLSSNVIASGSAERLIREAKALSSLNHPNIVTVYEVIRFGSSVAIAMELIEGQALRELCGSPLAPRRVIHLGLQIAQALAAAHGRGIVHRDIKPENIFLRSDGYIK